MMGTSVPTGPATKPSTLPREPNFNSAAPWSPTIPVNDGFTRLDPHVHTRFSDGTIFYNGLHDLKVLIRRHPINAFTITDHNTTRGIPYARRACRLLGIPFIPGVEVSTKQGHVVASGVDEWERPAYSLELVDALDILRDMNAVIILAHPFDGRMGAGKKMFDLEVQERIDGFEILNGASPTQNLRCTIKAGDLLRKPLALFSGSDCHSKVMFYKYHVHLDCNSSRVDDILEAMRDKRRVFPRGSLLDLVHLVLDFPPAEIGRRRLKRAAFKPKDI